MSLLKKMMFLCVALILLMSSCANSETPAPSPAQETPPASEPSTGDVAPGSTAESADSLKITEEKITFRVLVNNNAQHPADFNEMLLFQRMEEETNIHAEWIMPGSGYNEKKNLMLATGDLPDLFMMGLNATDLSKYGAEGSLIPMQDLVAEHAPNIMKIFEQVDGLKGFCTAPDGNMYGLPRINGGLWMRATGVGVINVKWLENLNLKMPTTIDEFTDVLRAFKDKDPNQNGEKDEFPLMFCGRIIDRNGFNFLISSFGIALGSNYLDVENGEVYCAGTDERFKKAIEYLASLNAEGLIDTEGFAMNDAQLNAKMSELPFKGGYAQVWDLDFFAAHEAAVDYDFLPLLKGPDGTEPVFYEVPFSGTARGTGAITSACQYPVEAVKWLDYFYEPTRSFEFCEGVIGDRLIEQPDGTYFVSAPPEGMDTGTHRHSQSPGASGLWTILPEGYEVLRVPSTYRKVEFFQEQCFPYSDSDPYPPVFYSPEESESLSLIQDTIVQYIERTCSEWIMAGEVTDWDKYVAELEKMGINEWLDIAQAAYDRFK